MPGTLFDVVKSADQLDTPVALRQAQAKFIEHERFGAGRIGRAWNLIVFFCHFQSP